MGICYPEARFLLNARLRGVSFTNTLTIGHQTLFLHPREVHSFTKLYSRNTPNAKFTPLMDYKFSDYSDMFFRDFLGTTSLSIMDYSDYEGADIVHDLNKQIPETLIGKYDSVVECGSIEHIFNFPTVIANLMMMVKVGGFIFISTPANNLCGHGFYQFSPELMFRIFSPNNGFDLFRVAIYEALFPGPELTSNHKIFEITDPANVKTRVGLISKKASMMMVEATKLTDAPLFSKPVLQSDYAAAWRGDTFKAKEGIKKKLYYNILKLLPFSIRVRCSGYVQKKHYALSNTKFYKKI